MKQIILLFFFLWTAGIQFAEAEVIFLKSGKIIDGQITERTSHQVQLLVNGDTITYPMSQVFRIIKDGESIFEITDDEKERSQDYSEKKELIIRLLFALNVPDSLNKLFLRLSNEAPEEAREEIVKLLKTDVILERIIPIYDTYYSEEELKSLIEFYSSPLGQKHLNTTPLIMEQTMRNCMEYFEEKAHSSN